MTSSPADVKRRNEDTGRSALDAVLHQYAEALQRLDRTAWLDLFAADADVTFTLDLDRTPVSCSTPEDLWSLVAGDWESGYWVQASAGDRHWIVVQRVLTVLNDDAGVVWEGFDVFQTNRDGHIVRLDCKDNRLVSLIL